MTMEVTNATESDLTYILGWLKEDYDKNGSGFWCNRRIIAQALEDEELHVIRRDGDAVAFQSGDYPGDIVCVREDHQRTGLGTALFEATLIRAMQDNICVLKGLCAPTSSLPYWEKHGFEICGSESPWNEIPIRRILHRSYELPSNLPRVRVKISFYPEAVIYSERKIKPIAKHKIAGAICEDGRIMLDRRIIGLMDDELKQKDLVVKITVDGQQYCFCKAKYEEAEEIGVQRDYHRGVFYIDRIAAKGE